MSQFSDSTLFSRFWQPPQWLWLFLITICTLSGCHTARKMPWAKTAQIDPVLAPSTTKEQVIASINRNHLGRDGRPALTSWHSGDVEIRSTELPVKLPATLSVQAPRNFRLLVSTPIVSTRRVDLGSNDERFWVWYHGEQEIMTASHEDVGFALDHMQVPVYVHPDWLMEVLGIKPIDGDEFEMQNSRLDTGTVDLVSRGNNQLGPDFERIIRVDLISGQIREHLLQQPGGKVIAVARLEQYTKLSNGNELPLKITLEWPDIRKNLSLTIKSPEANAAFLASNKDFWKVPEMYGPELDVGLIARAHIQKGKTDLDGLQQFVQEQERGMSKLAVETETPGQVKLTNSHEEHPWTKPVRTAGAEKLPRPIGEFGEPTSSNSSSGFANAPIRAPGSSRITQQAPAPGSSLGTPQGSGKSAADHPFSSSPQDQIDDDVPEWARPRQTIR